MWLALLTGTDEARGGDLRPEALQEGSCGPYLVLWMNLSTLDCPFKIIILGVLYRMDGVGNRKEKTCEKSF